MNDGHPAAMRASEGDRDAALADLSGHFLAGRLTFAEFEERSDQVLQARTVGDLARLTADLLPPRSAGLAEVPYRNPVTNLGLPRRRARIPAVLGVIAVAAAGGALIAAAAEPTQPVSRIQHAYLLPNPGQPSRPVVNGGHVTQRPHVHS